MQTAQNRLAKERSPYLKSASHQPVHWFPWCPEAFQEAARLDRPILLNIGASWCHGCHGVDRESYSNEEIAQYINERFIPIRVDRDERPEIDSRYQWAVNALTGQGGWPLIGFLTPEGNVFFGGTYFPPEDRYGKPGFKNILKRITGLYHTQKADILEDAKKISVLFREIPRETAPPEALNPENLERCLRSIKQNFDFAHGGFGNAPKFYHHRTLQLAIHEDFFLKQSWLRAVIEKTLEAMGKGGVYDQLGGGFHRHSVDERWVLPHFEKLSSDNASLLIVYSKAYSSLGKPFYEQIIRGITGWAGEMLANPRGGFCASQDSDTNLHDDGDYYTWTLRETVSLLNKEEARAVSLHLNIEAQGEMLHDPSRNVLFVAKEPEMIARELELKPRQVIRQIESAKKKLLAARKKRKCPAVDSALYTQWNALWSRAYLSAYRALRDPLLKETALKTLERFRREGFRPETGMARFLPGKETFREGLLEDQVEMLAASLEAFEVTGDTVHFQFAETLAGILFEKFTAEGGGFFDIAAAKPGEGHLRFRDRRIQDSPTGSPNATVAAVLLKLHSITGKQVCLDQTRGILQFFHSEAQSFAYRASGYFLALDLYVKGALPVAVVGRAEDPLFKRLHETALFTFHPHSVVIPLRPETRKDFPDSQTDLLYQEFSLTGTPFAAVGLGKTGLPFTGNPEQLAAQIRNAKSNSI